MCSFKENNFNALCLCTFLLTWLLFVRYSKHLQDCQSSRLLWHRFIGSDSHRGIASESQEKGTNCRCIEILQNEHHYHCLICTHIKMGVIFSLCSVVRFWIFLCDDEIFPNLLSWFKEMVIIQLKTQWLKKVIKRHNPKHNTSFSSKYEQSHLSGVKLVLLPLVLYLSPISLFYLNEYLLLSPCAE